MEPVPDTAKVAKNPRPDGPGPREKPNTIILLKEHNNKTTVNDILLILIAQRLAQLSSEILPPAADVSKHRDHS